jgi:hypothetical protein
MNPLAGRPRWARLVPISAIAALIAALASAPAMATNPPPVDSCGYPTGTGRSAVVFNEPAILRALTLTGAGADTKILAWYSDEHAMVLGVNPNPSGSPVTPMSPTTSPNHAVDPSVGDKTAVDPGGRPLYPSLFLTDITSNAASKAGDWQQQANNNSALAPDDVFGTWKAATKSGTSITPGANPTANSSFGAFADTPPSGISYEDFRTEIRWDATSLGVVPGHTYRVQAMIHDGDQTRVGGDAGEACATFTIPTAKLKLDKEVSVGNPAGTYVDGPAQAHVGDVLYYKIVVSNTGTTNLNVTTTDFSKSCGSGELYTTPAATTVVTMPQTINAGATATYYCKHTLVANDSGPNGDYVNTACTAGSTSGGSPATGDPTNAALCDTVTVKVFDPHLKLDKKVSPTAGSGYVDGPLQAYIGDVIYYQIVVTNTGNVPVDATTVDDNSHCDAIVTAPTGGVAVVFPETIAVGASKTYYCKHTLTTADNLGPGDSWTNRACVSGYDKATPPKPATAKQGDNLCDTTTVTVKRIKISGQKFEDANGNGQKDAGEAGIPSWTIYIDSNNNGTRDAGEPTTQTDANGYYEFTGLNPGSYTVREDVPNGWHCSTPSPCDYQLTLNGDKTGADFGNWQDASISGVKFRDVDADGSAREPGEAGLAGWTFYVDYNGNGSIDAGEPSAVSAADGSFKIDGVKPGAYSVREVSQAGWTCSFPGTCQYNVTFESGEVKSGADFGNWEPATVSGSKFADVNGNGVQDPGDTPLAGFVFYVDYNGNGINDPGEPSAASTSDGTWTITGVKPGSWAVREVGQAGYTCTVPANGCAYGVTLGAGETQTGKVFGNQPPAPAAIAVLPERITPGTATLTGRTGCVARAFSARVRGSKIATVTYILDGKTLKRFTNRNNATAFAVRINPAKMKIGVHRLVVNVTFAKGSGTKARTLRLSFQRCARRLAEPRFTG